VRLRWRYVPLIAVLGVIGAVLPGIAASETPPSVSAISTGSGGLYGYATYAWSPVQTTVMAGGTVTFSATSTPGVPHGVVWDSSVKPTCQGVPINAEAEGWQGTCTFSQAGTYEFHCFVHPTEMRGKIVVAANGTTTLTETTPTTAPPPPTTSTPSPTPTSGSPLVGAPALHRSQRGTSVHGSIDVSSAGSGDALEVELFAGGASLGGAGHSTKVQVGRFTRRSVTAGALAFSVKLNASARRALKHHKRLALTVKITLTPSQGKATTLTRSVVEHG
jgi:plastocyanin